MFDHSIYCFTFTNIHLQVCLKARIQTRIRARKVKVNVILPCFNTTRVTHLNIECLQITYLDSSPRFSIFLCNSDSSPLEIPPYSLPSSKIISKAPATLYLWLRRQCHRLKSHETDFQNGLPKSRLIVRS